ncbi:MAG: RNA-directed DNA polymerase, partial [Candidatus Magasanikbacteria bacterium]
EGVIGSYLSDVLESLRGSRFASADKAIPLSNLDCGACPEWGRGIVARTPPRNDRVGLPLGNLTSQLFANIYMNELDQFTKHKLKAKYYVRYADDFVFVSHDRKCLEIILEDIQDFLIEKLKLILHPNKIFLQTTTSGIDFLGWKHFEDHRVLRKTTQKRMFVRIKNHPTEDTLNSYLGLVKHGDGLKLRDDLLNDFWLNVTNGS